MRVRDFPEAYDLTESPLEYRNDPDGLTKLRSRRLNLKFIFLGLFVSYHLIQWRVRQVERFDRLKRKEQRAMQNTEAEEVYNKMARFTLFTPEGKQFNQDSIATNQGQAKAGASSTISGSRYYVFWYDSKMRNYELFVEYLLKKRLTQADI